MNFENLLILTVGITTIAVMAAAVLNPFLGGRKISIARSLYGGALAFVLGAIGGAFGNIFSDPQMGILIGIILGFVLGYTLLISKLIKWLWKKFWAISTWWVKLIIGALTLILVIWVVTTYIV